MRVSMSMGTGLPSPWYWMSNIDSLSAMTVTNCFASSLGL
jgi:hypothetical protein